MNYLPFAGYYFYGAANATQRAHFYSSWGLMADLPTPTTGGVGFLNYLMIPFIFMKIWR